MERNMKTLPVSTINPKYEADDIDAAIRIVGMSQAKDKRNQERERRLHIQRMRRIADDIFWYITGVCSAAVIFAVIALIA